MTMSSGRRSVAGRDTTNNNVPPAGVVGERVIYTAPSKLRLWSFIREGEVAHAHGIGATRYRLNRRVTDVDVSVDSLM
ncbi:hypothetical protein EVAR_93501_1 [Eumeta japonica]|uniref:Uncharacterized protein n=1 Tax=Eumeta variegata TaxID=151549 RepID=A0A4C1TMP0_EUMVA|nr:hypothetical protein EVAR_93501_1 [Eumeta japonica]